MVRAVARGSTIKIFRVDSESLRELIEFLNRDAARDFTGRIEGEIGRGDKRYSVLLLIEHGKVVGVGLSNDEELRGDPALSKFIEILRSGEGFLELSQLTEAGVKLDIEFNDGIQLSKPIGVTDLVDQIRKTVESVTSGPTPTAAPSLEVKAPRTVVTAPRQPAEVVEAATSIEASKPSTTLQRAEAPTVARPSVGMSLEEFKETLAKAIRELEEKLGPIEAERIPPPPPGAPRLRIEDLPLRIATSMEALSSFMMDEICNLAPRIFLRAIPLAKGSGRILDILTRVREYIGRLGEEGPYLLIVRYGNRAFYSILVKDTMCCIVELNEIPLQPLERGPRALENMISNPEVELHFILWKIPGSDELIKRIADQCRVEELKETPPATEEKVEESRPSEAAQPRRRRFFRIFGR